MSLFTDARRESTVKIEIGSLVKTNEYYNTRPFGGVPISEGRVTEINISQGQEIASVSIKHEPLRKISTQWLVRM